MTLSATLHEQALSAAANYFRAEAVLLDILQKIEESRAYREQEYTSLFSYAVGALKLPEGTAYSFINVARKAREVPALKVEIDRGELSVNKARRIVPVLTLENQEEWIGKAKTMSQRSLEREVARANPSVEQTEKAKYVSETRLNLSLGISEKLLEKLKRVQDLESQRTKKAAALEDALEAMAENYLERNDPVRKAVRAKLGTCQKSPSPRANVASEKAPPQLVRRPLPAAVAHAVNHRDGARCAHVHSDGRRCENRRWLDIHHVKPVFEGGTDEIGNLTTLCSGHHRIEHGSAEARFSS